MKRLCSYVKASGGELDEDNAYHHLICFCWDRLGRGPMKGEYQDVDTKIFGVDSYLLAAMERAAVRLIDHVIVEEKDPSDVVQYLNEQIDLELANSGERSFQVLERV